MKKESCTCGKACGCQNCVSGPFALFFDTLGNTIRLTILNAVRARPSNVSELVQTTGIEQTLVFHSLKRLELCGFVTKKAEGKNRIYSVNAKTVEPLMKLIESHVGQYCAKHAKPCTCAKRKPL